MSTPQISLQLWSLREETKTDFVSTIKAVAAMGYQGVETAAVGHAGEPANPRVCCEPPGECLAAGGSPNARGVWQLPRRPARKTTDLVPQNESAAT